MNRQELWNPIDGEMVASLHRDSSHPDTWAIYNPEDTYLWSVTYFKDNEPGAGRFIRQKESEGFTVSTVEKRDPFHRIVILVVADEAKGETLRNGVRAYSQARQQFLSHHRTRYQIEANGEYTRGTYEAARSYSEAAKLREGLAKAKDRVGAGVFEGEEVIVVRQGNGYNVARLVVDNNPSEHDVKWAGKRARAESLALLAFWQFDPFSGDAKGVYGVRYEQLDENGGMVNALYDVFTADNEAQAQEAAQAKLDFCKVKDVQIESVWQSIDDPAHSLNTAPR